MNLIHVFYQFCYVLFYVGLQKFTHFLWSTWNLIGVKFWHFVGLGWWRYCRRWPGRGRWSYWWPSRHPGRRGSKSSRGWTRWAGRTLSGGRRGEIYKTATMRISTENISSIYSLHTLKLKIALNKSTSQPSISYRMEVDTPWSWPVRPKSLRASWTGLVAFYLHVKTNTAASELRRDLKRGTTQCNPLSIRSIFSNNVFRCYTPSVHFLAVGSSVVNHSPL